MLGEACQDSRQWICYRLADSASSGELPATRAAAVPQRWREARLPNAEFVFTARGAVCRYDAPSQMRQALCAMSTRTIRASILTPSILTSEYVSSISGSWSSSLR